MDLMVLSWSLNALTLCISLVALVLSTRRLARSARDGRMTSLEACQAGHEAAIQTLTVTQRRLSGRLSALQKAEKKQNGTETDPNNTDEWKKDMRKQIALGKFRSK